MASPLVPQGTLNRLRGSITFVAFQDLNITASYLGPEGINMTPEGPLTENLPTMTGTVPSPFPYQMYTVEVELLKTQGFSDLFKQQLELSTYVGDFVVRPDTTTLGNYLIRNASIMQASPGRINGTSVSFALALQGYYQVNAALYLSS